MQNNLPTAARPSFWAPWDALLDRLLPALYPVLLLLAMTVQTQVMSMILAGLAVVVTIGATPAQRLGQRLGLPLLGYLIYALMNLLASVYAPVGVTAVQEAVKFLASFSLTWLVLVRMEKEKFRYLFWGFAAVCAVISLLCVDSACNGPLFGAFEKFASALGADYSGIVVEGSYSTRVNGIYNDANITAGLLSLSCLVGLHLVRTEQVRWKQCLAFFLLGINAMGNFLSVSRGGLLCFGVALVVYLFAAGKGARLPLFFLMLETAICTVALSVVAMRALGSASLLPDLLTLVCGVPVLFLDLLLGRHLSRALEGKGKAIAAVCCVLVVAIIAYLVAAVNLTGAYTFNDSGLLFRTVSLAPGDYTLTLDSSDEVKVTVYTQSKEEEIAGTSTTLYSGAPEEAAFTVTGEEEIHFRFDAASGTELRSVTLSDGTSLKLNYRLLPSFVADRLQGSLLSNSSTWLRLQYDIDGLKLFMQRPLLGYGLGSTEAWLGSVQPYYYESAYVHNHLIQAADDMGIVGLLSLLALMGGTAWLLLRRLRKEADTLAAMLLACWTMMNLHGLMELNFSIRAYQCAAFFLLAAVIALYGTPLLKKEPGRFVRYTAAALSVVYLATYGVLVWNNWAVNREREEFTTTSAVAYLSALERFAQRNVLDPEDLQLLYVAQAVTMELDEAQQATMLSYVDTLRSSGTYIACTGLAQMYYLPAGELEEVFASSLEGIWQVASNADAWNEQMDFYRTKVLPAAGTEGAVQVAAGVRQLGQAMDAYNEGRVQPVELSEENQVFLNSANTAWEKNFSDEATFQLLLTSSGLSTASMEQ